MEPWLIRPVSKRLNALGWKFGTDAITRKDRNFWESILYRGEIFSDLMGSRVRDTLIWVTNFGSEKGSLGKLYEACLGGHID